MPLNPYATATIYIHGLALCRHHQGLWEVLFLHPPGSCHETNVTVIQRKYTSPPHPTDTVLLNEKIPPCTPLAVTVKSAIAASPEYRPGNWQDTNDMCWLVDMDDLHSTSSGPGIQLKAHPPMPLSYLTIAAAKFHTDRITPEFYSLKQPSAPQPVFVRQIGDVIGADIVCDDGGEIVLTIGGKDTTLPQDPGMRYDIILDNDCHGSGGPDDFHYYYDIIDLAPGDEPYVMTEVQPSWASSIRVMTDEGACNPPIGGRNSIVSFKEAFEESCDSSSSAQESSRQTNGGEGHG